MTTSVEKYRIEGCGRCDLGGTPNCKVHTWINEIEYLRHLVLSTELQEFAKWGVPCYTINEKNVLIISAFKEYASISFFKGILLNDPHKLLVKAGEESHAGRLIRFKSLDEIRAVENELKAIIKHAIEVEKAGVPIPKNENTPTIPAELTEAFDEDPNLLAAFNNLTPGRQRGFIIHFSQPKQAKTRTSRIQKCTPMIMNGIGLNDKYSSSKG